jgi:hypothetical protein
VKRIKFGKLTVICGLGVNETTAEIYKSKRRIVVNMPERGKHPVNQRKYIRNLATLINQGIEYIIVTHSDYILKEINTLIMLKTPNCEKIMEKYGYKNKELISHNDIRVYEMSLDGKITKADIHPELGVEAKSFDATIDEMNEIQEKIMFGLEDT